MTVTYTAQVATSRGFSTFLLLLARWRGSIYKLVWLDLLIFQALYIMLTLSYRMLMNDRAQKIFEGVVHYCHLHATLIPLSFVLGFYVSIVMTRWWAQYITIPWPDSVAILVSAHIQGNDDRARAMRRTVMRYICLCQVIVFTLISPRVKKRFPTYNQIIEAGLLLENEKIIIEALDAAFPHYPKHWMPIVWAASIVMRARREGKIRDDYAVKSIIDELNKFRGRCGFLLYYDWVSVPLVYTQVVTLATYAFFLCSVVGQQWTMDPSSRAANNKIDQYFPLFTTLQFFFYMGWLKVAESLINPFGDDDDDFELNWMIDRNLTVSYLIVDEMHQNHPELVKDQYWDEVFPNELPYTNESQRQPPPEASTAKLDYLKSKSFAPLDARTHKSTLISSSRTSDFENILPHLSSFLGRMMRKSRSSSTIYDYPTNLSISEEFMETESEMQEIHAQQNSMNFEQLMEERNRQRQERMRNRFLNLRTTRNANIGTGGYKITVLHAPSLRGSQQSVHEPEEEEEEEEQPSSSKKKLEKHD
ncbi:bestrophin-4 [Scaptodrosophila lebanonensis]|uniref:Bestrophin homolog n=1 Tax=Drosophila lebanonensis TaxID=7225 RepID=A0A6J2UB64_DROLE|nr:bestrophin-4 [Scaptodrosophila lebanonensis]